ncbi:MAG: AI-2E family transporter [Rhodospirillaceae bacterium]
MSETPRNGRAMLAAWILAGIGLVLVLHLHLLPALLAGLLVFELVHIIIPFLQRHVSSDRARIMAVIVLATVIVGVVTAAIIGALTFFRSEAGSVPALLQKLADIIEDARRTLPEWLVAYLPAGTEELQAAVTRWLREHAAEVRLFGAEAGRVFVHVLIGMVIGAMVSLREARPGRDLKPLARALTAQAEALGEAFRRVVFAQVRISALNTSFTAIYLLVLLPVFGVHLPFVKTLVGLTFVAGLIPVVGNLISNGVILAVSLGYSAPVAVASLAFLVSIHKLEYFLNARIVGSRIHSRAWELLLAMLVMEAAFGLAGVVAAPVYYAYLKRELAANGLV